MLQQHKENIFCFFIHVNTSLKKWQYNFNLLKFDPVVWVGRLPAHLLLEEWGFHQPAWGLGFYMRGMGINLPSIERFRDFWVFLTYQLYLVWMISYGFLDIFELTFLIESFIFGTYVAVTYLIEVFSYFPSLYLLPITGTQFSLQVLFIKIQEIIKINFIIWDSETYYESILCIFFRKTL